MFGKTEMIRSFVRYSAAHRAGCLAVFDSNADRYFAPFERNLFAEFLDARALAEPFFVLLDSAAANNSPKMPDHCSQ
jgi:hypothetical protein